MSMIKVAVLGACGKMGREVVKAVVGASDMILVGACDAVLVGGLLSDVVGVDCGDVKIESDFRSMIDTTHAQVVVDFAKPFVMENALYAIEKGVAPVIGTTGLTASELADLENAAGKHGVCAMVIPNFAIGAVLMMKFAAEAAKYMPDVEIIELHHDKKADAPSGTSIKTAEMIEEARKLAGSEPTQPLGSPDDRARGDEKCGVRVHSVRLPGLVAHQEVLFGGQGQLLTIRHDSLDRTSFMPGVLLAIRKTSLTTGFVYGLDKLL